MDKLIKIILVLGFLSFIYLLINNEISQEEDVQEVHQKPNFQENSKLNDGLNFSSKDYAQNTAPHIEKENIQQPYEVIEDYFTVEPHYKKYYTLKVSNSMSKEDIKKVANGYIEEGKERGFNNVTIFITSIGKENIDIAEIVRYQNGWNKGDPYIVKYIFFDKEGNIIEEQ